MLQFTVKQLFFDRAAVINALDRASRRVLSKFGAFVRTRARSSMRPARQKSLEEMSTEERAWYETALRRAKREGRPKPRRPRASSKPGEPPRVQTGLLKQHLYFSYDPEAQSAVIGPAALNAKDRSAPETLEYGGRTAKGHAVAPRPYMGPAYLAEEPRLPGMWADSVRA